MKSPVQAYPLATLIAALLIAGCDGSAYRASEPSVQAEVTPRTTVTAGDPSVPEIQPQLTVTPPAPRSGKSPTGGVATSAAPVPAAEPPPTADPATSTKPPPPPASETAPAATPAGSEDGALTLLGQRVPPASMRQLTWSPTETFTGAGVAAAVLVVNGAEPGPVLCLTAAVHGDELNGIETVRRVVHGLQPGKLTGTVIGVPIVNVQGFQRHSRYLPDRRDLNRFFPGNPGGSSASRIAHSLFNGVIRHCDHLVDLHTGSFHRTNLPQLRADLNAPAVVALTEGFGDMVVLHSEGAEGTLRRAALEAGVAAVTLEAGAPLQVQDDEVRRAEKGIRNLLDALGMYNKRNLFRNPEPVYYSSRWVRADSGGILFSDVKLGRKVKRGDLLGTITDPISNKQTNVISPYSGRVLGMALDQFVMPGFATFHIGIESDVDEATHDSEVPLHEAVAAYEPERDQFE